jgi:hypothetical protein
MSPDPTGYWYNPNEAGWGVAIAQQNDVLFVTLLVYDEQKRPAWFVASSVREAGSGVFSGTLYRMSGPTLGGNFDPAFVGSQAVGTLSVRYAVNFGGQASLLLNYTVDGVAVSKGIVRLTWESNVTRLPGAYFGGINISLAAVSQLKGCPAAPTSFPPGGQFRINVSAPDTVAIFADEGIDTVSLIGGTYQQSGQFGLINGGLFRGPIVSPFKVADAQVTNLIVSDDGFNGHVRFTIDNNCLYEGAIAGMRR